jgi:hypothetical protein
MGWISDRAMRRGSSLYSGGPKRKGPLKKVVGVLGGDAATNMFGSDTVLLECGHVGRSYGGQRAICPKCKDGKPMDLKNDWGIDVMKTIENWKQKQCDIRDARREVPGE